MNSTAKASSSSSSSFISFLLHLSSFCCLVSFLSSYCCPLIFQISLIFSSPQCLSPSLLSPVRMLREELQLLHEPGSYVGEVIKLMGKSKVLVKVSNSRKCRKNESQI